MDPGWTAHLLKYGVVAIVLFAVLGLLLRYRMRTARAMDTPRPSLFPWVALLLGPLLGLALWAILVLPRDDLITMYERVDFLPRFLGIGLVVGVIVSIAIAVLERR